MTDTVPSDILDFVRSSARLLELSLDDAQLARVAEHLARTRTLVAPLRLLPLGADLEPAEIYCPAPFPVEDPA